LKNIYLTNFEQFSVTLSSAWNISGILHVGPHIGNYLSGMQNNTLPWKIYFFPGISYQTHPQASLTNVAQFKDVVSIKTCTLPKEKLSKSSESTTELELQNFNCNCQKIKTQIKISASNNVEDLVITCNGINVSLQLRITTITFCNANLYF